MVRDEKVVEEALLVRDGDVLEAVTIEPGVAKAVAAEHGEDRVPPPHPRVLVLALRVLPHARPGRRTARLLDAPERNDLAPGTTPSG